VVRVCYGQSLGVLHELRIGGGDGRPEEFQCGCAFALGDLMGCALDDGENNAVVDLDPACVLVLCEEGSAE
jgi:hypothetical protein